MEYNGLSGFLAPDGVYHHCNYKEHDELARRLVEMYKINLLRVDSNDMPDFIKFGCYPWTEKVGDESNCHAFINSQPTEPQINWMINNFDLMTIVQKNRVLREFGYRGIEYKEEDQ